MQALKEGLKAGIIDVIATDHAPHTAIEKGVGIKRAPFGIVGLENSQGHCLPIELCIHHGLPVLADCRDSSFYHRLYVGEFLSSRDVM